MKKLNLFLTSLFLFIALLTTSQETQIPNRSSNDILAKVIGKEDKVLHISANLVVDTPEDLFVYIDRAKAAGANTVLYSDTKLNSYGLNGTAGSRWDERIQILVDGIKERGMKLHFITISMGFASSLIASNPNLTTAYPITDQELIASNGELIPVSSSNLVNGGFENSSENRPDGWQFQDAPGERTFIDTNTKRSGNASFRADARDNQMSRIITTFDVKPFHQYVLRCWIKTENLSASNLLPIIRDDNNKDRNLTNLRFSLLKSDGGRSYFNRPNNLTIDWTEMRIAFNSLNATKVNLGLSLFGGTNGSIWWDDIEVIDTPSLNWINRDDLPVSISKSNGQNLQFGNDVELPTDPKLGLSGFAGSFDTHHTPPKIIINSGVNIKEGDIVKITGYHGLPTASGQISASWNHPEIYNRMRTIHQKLYNDFQPDGFLLNYSEIRTGGWEPLDTQIGNSGTALATSIEHAFEDLFEVAPDASYYFWSDMIDPEHNAIANYYQINNTLDQSWVTVNPEKVILATWWEGQKIVDRGTKSLQFFSDLGFKQIVGAFYDADVDTNFNQWQTASEGVENIIGSIYATWVKPRNFSQIENFGALWWQGEDNEIDITGKLWRLENKVNKQWVRTEGCSNDYSETIPLVVTSTNNTGNCTMFEFIPTDDGYYFLQNKATNGRYRPKDCSNTSNDSIEIVQVGPGSFGWCEQWKLVATDEEGYFRIQNRQTSSWIRSQGCSAINDESIPITQVSQGYTGNCTKWKLIDVDNQVNRDFVITNEEDIKLFPNPVSKEIFIQKSVNDTNKIVAINIYDLQGRKQMVIDSKKLMSNGNTIEVSHLVDGLYILSVDYHKKETQNLRFMVKH
ncbi:T9SS C-terminal target domain-containing protein [Aquimarina sp. BL5]|uniref:T9SS type A sorting domain-containing protein n=1 Tax=Aquimarina sp. BL5 TaxID=1714860 RepID=UPI000E4FC865|nr:T9SS type A sorting domain-containing protein [Aquimarina sp. BL5]AXT51266.1 T9SS C-terminal target domain-containing protein [Aquimarina sp. BL5]RKN09477.1 T9SS C-terminal target domain-containing protein [Aquimarina sp. BL5]